MCRIQNIGLRLSLTLMLVAIHGCSKETPTALVTAYDAYGGMDYR